VVHRLTPTQKTFNLKINLAFERSQPSDPTNTLQQLDGYLSVRTHSSLSTKALDSHFSCSRAIMANNYDSWEDAAAQDEDLSRQTQNMNMNANTFRPGASSFQPGATAFQPGQSFQQYNGYQQQYGGYGQQQAYNQPQQYSCFA